MTIHLNGMVCQGCSHRPLPEASRASTAFPGIPPGRRDPARRFGGRSRVDHAPGALALSSPTHELSGPTHAVTLIGRALLAPDASAAAPFPGVPDTEPAPAPDASQPVGGFSALLDASGRDTFWVMPDNGFGSKTNSRSFLLHTDATGRLLEAPIPLPGVESPDSPVPTLVAPNLRRFNGFEALAISPDRGTLYPILEGPVDGADPATRRVHAFDLATRRYLDRLPAYRVAGAALLVSDATALDGRRLVVLELDIRGPATISLPGRPGDIGLGENFSMPYVTIESVLPIGGHRLVIVNDTNFGSTGASPTAAETSPTQTT